MERFEAFYMRKSVRQEIRNWIKNNKVNNINNNVNLDTNWKLFCYGTDTEAFIPDDAHAHKKRIICTGNSIHPNTCSIPLVK